MQTPGKHTSPWTDTAERPTFPQLEGDIAVDVAIVGGGITGLTAAALLKRAGRSVAVIEALRIGSGVSGRTTAHLTLSADARYQELASTFGLEGARHVAESQRAAIECIAAFAAEERIDCDFERVPGYLYTETTRDIPMLQREAEIANRLGIAVRLIDDVPLPFPALAAVQFDNQAQFHPLKYLYGLARTIPGNGCHIFEQTRVLDIRDGTICRIHTDQGDLRANQVILATHAPIHSFGFLADLLVTIQSKVVPYRSYVLGVRLDGPPPQGLFWDTADPYHYLRRATDAQGDLLIVGGADHQTGHVSDTTRHYTDMECYVQERFAVTSVDYYWSAQSFEPADGLPYIGAAALHPRIYVATGYSGNGMTFGTMAGILLADQLQGRANPWSDLYGANRLNLSGGGQLVSFNVDVAARYVGDRLRSDGTALPNIPHNEGRIVSIGGEQFAVYRDADGQLHSFSPVCTHAHCIVRWNAAEKTWDCPCHGGRYDAQGFVLNGPPVYDLAPKPLEGWLDQEPE